MESIKFPEANTTIEDPMGIHPSVELQFNKGERSANICFQLSKKELKQIAKEGKIWLKQFVPKGQLNPMRISTKKEDIISLDIEIIKNSEE